MRANGRENRTALARTFLWLIVCTVLLESRGLLTWSERLELSSTQGVIQDVCTRLAAITERTGIPAARTTLLALVSSRRPADDARRPPAPPGSPDGVSPSPASMAQQAPADSTAAASGVAGMVAAASAAGAASGVVQAETSAKTAQAALVVAASGVPPRRVATGTIRVVGASGVQPTSGTDKAPMTVALVGDSMMAVALGPYLTRTLSASQEVRVVRAYRSGTGLARPDVFDWLAHYPEFIGSSRPDLVICAIGANDAQNFTLNGRPVQFGSPEWNQEYQRRVGDLLDGMAAQKPVRVLWLALPSMRNKGFSRRVAELNAVVKEKLANRPGVTWLETNPLLGGGADSYVEFQKNSRKHLERLRQSDGIHLTDPGAERVGQGVISWVAKISDQPRSGQGASITAGLYGVPSGH